MNQKTNTLLIYNFFAACLVAGVFLLDKYVGAAAFVIFVFMAIYSVVQNRRAKKRFKEHIQNIMSEIDTAGKYASSNLPIPIVVIGKVGQIKWFNTRLTDLLEDKEIFGASISDVLPDLNIDFVSTGFSQEAVQLGESYYNIYSGKVEENEDTILYLFDVTQLRDVKQLLEESRLVVGLINVDNFDEVVSEVGDEQLPFVTSEIEKRIGSWGAGMGALIRKYASDKFMFVCTYEKLEEVVQRKFTILDQIREIEAGNKIPITLSIGIDYGAESPLEKEREAYSCLELALGRGGDQAVLKKNGNLEFYGGKSKAVERRNRVKARVIAHGVRSLIDESSKVLIMGHRVPDMDAFGACVGVYRAAMLRGSQAHIVLGTEGMEGIESVYETLKDNEEYSFVGHEDAKAMVDSDTLLVVCDTHKQSITECPELVDMIDRVVVIDHHRRAAEYIDKALVKYMEPYASSASELVAEILQYIASKPSLLKEEADALLAGITVDTKNFTIKTGVRTFDAAAFLRKHGADPVKVRQLFQDDLSVFTQKAAIVGEAERYKDRIAISVSDIQSDMIQLVAAQAADDLLDIKGIAASFVIASKSDNSTFISGRSLGDVNVQVVLEILGGGGHLEVAGAQFEDKTIYEVRELLVGAIDKYLSEGEEE